jgi:hypothetical protein
VCESNAVREDEALELGVAVADGKGVGVMLAEALGVASEGVAVVAEREIRNRQRSLWMKGYVRRSSWIELKSLRRTRTACPSR